MVGNAPRVVASLNFADPKFATELASIATTIDPFVVAMGGKSLAECGVTVPSLGNVGVAVGEPLRIDAQLDGSITVAKLRCVLGERQLATLATEHAELRDRPEGGVAISLNAQPRTTSTAVNNSWRLRCPTSLACLSAVLGPAAHPFHVGADNLDHSIEFQLSGDTFAPTAAAIATAFQAFRTTQHATIGTTVTGHDGALSVVVPITEARASGAVLKSEFYEPFKVPSESMIPTLLQGDHFYATKPSMTGSIAPGDVVVFRRNGQSFVSRVVAIGGQRVDITADAVTIDGVRVPSEVVDANYAYEESDADVVQPPHKTPATLVREHLGAHAYLTLADTSKRIGSWTVPADQVFLLGDNRSVAHDSRDSGAIPMSAIVGRAVAIYLAYPDGVPDWNRMGTAIE